MNSWFFAHHSASSASLLKCSGLLVAIVDHPLSWW
jgi:hypothetical protein